MTYTDPISNQPYNGIYDLSGNHLDDGSYPGVIFEAAANLTISDLVVNTMTVSPPPIELAETDLGYGTDLWCTDDCTDTFEEITDTTSALGVAQSNYRRLRTSRGQLPDDLNYGIDIRSYINKGVTVRDLQLMAGSIRNELLKDDRNLTIAVTFSPLSLTEYAINIKGTTDQGPFSLTLALVDGDLLLKEIYGNT